MSLLSVRFPVRGALPRIRRGALRAIDAAVATSFAIGVLEPWMSGIGGGGLMVLRHPDGRVKTVDFGMRAPAALDPAAYPLAPGEAEGLFAWPAVVDDRNMRGPLAIAVPGVVAGLGEAHACWGTRPWAELVAPTVDLARRGLSVDWYATMVIGAGAAGLATDPASRERFLPGGHPPAPPMAPRAETLLPMPALAATLETIAAEGWQVFYRGRLAEAIGRDAAAVGSPLSAADLAAFAPRVAAPIRIPLRGATVHATPELSAGPTLSRALALHQAAIPAPAGPDAAWYASVGAALREAYAERLTRMGDVDGVRSTGCTTHFGIVDRSGMVVSLTQTLLSVFGSMVTLPGTGILMNNGIFWFDPRPGRPNSIGPGKRCLANMCPVVAVAGDRLIGAGASGGRRILPAVMQTVAAMVEHGMGVEQAVHMPRIDMSGTDTMLVDAAMAPEIRAALAARFDVEVQRRVPYPSWFANISVVERHDGVSAGCVEPGMPWGDAVAGG